MEQVTIAVRLIVLTQVEQEVVVQDKKYKIMSQECKQARNAVIIAAVLLTTVLTILINTT